LPPIFFEPNSPDRRFVLKSSKVSFTTVHFQGGAVDFTRKQPLFKVFWIEVELFYSKSIAFCRFIKAFQAKVKVFRLKVKASCFKSIVNCDVICDLLG
jgi:hypothetical protein